LITVQQYLGPWDGSKEVTEEIETNAYTLLMVTAKLMEVMEKEGVSFPINPATKSQISGSKYGGFRPQGCTQGAPLSKHKTGEAVDIWDPLDEIDDWLMEHQPLLTAMGIYIEHPDYTKGWSHWSIKAPKSGHHVFIP
jgi:hypothetical protein